MARKLAYTVHVPVPDSAAEYEVFLRGETLPDWAASLVGDHVYAADENEDPEPDPEPDPTPEKPAGNASVDAWREYAASLRGVTPEDVADMSRNELRDKYGN